MNLLLFISIFIRITSEIHGINPVYFLLETLEDTLRFGDRFKSRLLITLNTIDVPWSNAHGISIFNFILYTTRPSLESKLR